MPTDGGPATSGQLKRAFARGVRDFLGRDAPLVEVLRQAEPFPEPVPVFTLTLADLLDQSRDLQPKSAGWRFMTADESGNPVVGEVTATGREAPQMTSLSTDDRMRDTVRLTREIPESPRMQQDHELRMLRMPGVLVDAFWLKSSSPGNDFYIPALTCTDDLTVGEFYSTESFFAAVRPLARKFAEFDHIGGMESGG
jgi:hypothetical protein